ncbi:MAG: DUF2764 family protein [Deltaproteobacteria bacterium]|nr:DUF2764 family protein [Deltaproteobacteria bacterium]
MKYYFLVSYLPELSREDKKLKLRLAELLSEMSNFTEKDRRQLELVILARDISLIEKLLTGRDTPIENTLYDREFWKDQIKSPKDVEEFFADFFEACASEGATPKNLDRLYETYYDYVTSQTDNAFLLAYFQFEKELRNILAAVRARKKGLSPADFLVGEGDVVDTLSKSGAEDFGLGKDYPWIDRLLTVKNPAQLEESVDRIIWDYLDEKTETVDFDFDVILAYALKLQLLERNLALSEERGMDIVQQLEGF